MSGDESSPIDQSVSNEEKNLPPTLLLEKQQNNSPPATSEAGEQQFLAVHVGPGDVPTGGHTTQAVYTVSYRTNLPQFASSEGSIRRRFADFVSLWCRLHDGFAKFGVVLPARPPDRPLAEAARARIFGGGGGDSGEASNSSFQQSVSFANRRRARLARFLARCADHPDLRNSRELLDFLEGRDGQPAVASSGSGGVGAVRALAASIGDSVAALGLQGALAADEEPDEWFADRYDELDDAAGRLGRLRACLESVAGQRRTYASQTGRLAENLGRLAGTQRNAELGLALGRMAQSIISLCQLQASQAEVEELELCDLLADHNDGLASQRDCLTERARARRALSDAETALNKRREARIRAELAGRAAASGPSPADIEAFEDEVERRQLDFEAVSQAARRELARADRRRDVELRAAVAACLRSQAEAARRALIGLEAAASETAALLAPADRAVSQSVTGSSADC